MALGKGGKILKKLSLFLRTPHKKRNMYKKKIGVKNYHCITIKNWLVVFTIEDDTFYVRYIIHSSLMK